MKRQEQLLKEARRRKLQCIRCINKKSDKCKNNDMYLIREGCCDFIPRSYKSNNNLNERDIDIEKLKNIFKEDKE